MKDSYIKRWSKLGLHPLQSEAWSNVRDNTTMLMVANMPTLVAISKNPLTKKPFASVLRGGFDGMDAADWTAELPAAVKTLSPNATHLILEPNGNLDNIDSSFVRYKLKPSDAQYTIFNDLSKTPEELLANCSKSHRQNINKAVKRGLELEVFSTGDDGLERFLAVMANASTSKNFLQFDSDHFRNVWQSLSEADMAYITIGTFGGQDIGAYMVVHNNHTAYQFYSGRTETGRRERLAQGLAFATMITAQQYGCELYDMWGIGKFDSDGILDKSDEKYGIGQFKAAFGGKLTKHGDTMVHVYSQYGYLAFRLGKRVQAAQIKLKKLLGKT